MFCSRCGAEVQPATQFCPTCGLDLRVTTPVQAIATGDVTELDIVREALSDEYELLEELGRGGMAIVYRAMDKHLEREVAIKVLPFSLAFDAEFVERFTREARTSAQLEHPNIIPIYRVGKTGRVIHFVMKFLRGGSLSRVMAERKRLAPAEIRKLLTDVGGALGYAHKRGIVHRDIKPDNIMFDEFGQCVVTDFGIAKAGTGSKLTGTGMSIGTPHYMSPEQARAQSIDGRSDLYSLGILAYQALVGEVPYDGEDSFAIGYKHIMEPIPVPLLDTVDERRVFEIIKRLIAKDPFDRFQDAEALLKALEGQPRESVAARRISTAQAILSPQSTTPLPAASVPLSPLSQSGSNPALSPRRASESVMMPGEARRPVMRRSVVVQEPPKSGWVPWLFVLLAVLGFTLGGLYLYRAGVLGGPVRRDSTPGAVAPDTLQAGDSLFDEDALLPGAGLDGQGAASAPETPASRPVVAPPASATRQEPTPTDSGVLLFGSLPDGTNLFIDSRQVARGSGGISLPVGWHEIGISAPGYALYIDSVRIEGGRTVQFSPNLSATNSPAPPPGSAAELRRRALARLDCDNPAAANKFGRACYDTPPQPLSPMRVPIPNGGRTHPSPVVLIVKVSRQGKTLALRTRQASNDPAFTRAVESYAQGMSWTPAMREGQPVDGWTQAPFQPDTP